MMRPVDFLSLEDEDQDEIKEIKKALKKDLVISDGPNNYTVLSYYYSPELKRMCLDIALDE